MTIVLLFGRNVTTPGVSDTGVGTDSASLLLALPKSGTDSGHGVDNASVVVPGVALEILPKITLQVSFDAPAGPIYREAVTTAPATVYYRLNEASGPVVDTMSNVNLTAVGGVTRNQTTLVSGESADKSYDFNGTTGYLRGVDNAVLDADEITIEALISPDSVTGTRSIMRRITSIEAESDIWGLSIIDGRLNLFVSGGDEGVPFHPIAPYTYWSTKILAPSTQYHIMVILRANQIEFYVDGVLADFIPKSWTIMKRGITPPPEGSPEGTLPTVLATELIVGAGSLTGGVFTEFFDGRIDEPAVYTFPLPQEAALYHQTVRTAPTSYSWTTISSDTSSQIKELSTQSGRQDIFRDTETGVFTGVMENQDRAFDPSYTGSPYYPNLRPAVPLRCIASKDGVSYNLFRGDVEDWPQNWQGRVNEVPLTALDAFDVLAGAKISVSNGVELTGPRIHAILDAAAWPRELRDIDAGSSYVQAWDHIEGDAKSLLNQVVLAESGHLYIDGRGYVVFRDRNTRFNTPVAVTFSNVPTGAELPITDAKVVQEKDQIYNHISIQITGREAHVAQSPVSVLQNRLRSLELELPLEDNTEGDIKANWLLQLYKDPFKRIKEVLIEPQQNPQMWTHALGRVIGDRIRFKIYPPGPGTFTQLEAHIEYISHKMVVGRWTTQWILSPADVNQYWILGTSQLGVNTKLAY
jgi:Concanavalin A-like lectin/glucanases superfamily